MENVSWYKPMTVSSAPVGDVTYRQVVHVSAGSTDGTHILVTNQYGKVPLTVVAAYIADPVELPNVTNQRRLTFGNNARSVTIPAGKTALSDDFPNIQGSRDYVVSLHVNGNGGTATYHGTAVQANYKSGGGNAEIDVWKGAVSYSTSESYFYLQAVHVQDSNIEGTVVAFGPSTTDGYGSTVGANHRYPDYLADDLLSRPAGQRWAVANAGLFGNQLLRDQDGSYGVSGLHRYEQDVLSQPGVKYVIVWEGTNDLSNGATAAQLEPAYQTLISGAHQNGITVIGATLQPTGATGTHEAQREDVNDWIRSSGAFDKVADFDAALRDPAHPSQLDPPLAHDSEHPNDAGYHKIAGVVAPLIG